MRGQAASERVRVVNASRGTVLADDARRARTFLARLRGLIGQAALPPGSGLLLDGDNAIHTCLMRVPIDAAFLDQRGIVVHQVDAMPPWRASRVVWRARAVLELPAGTLARTGTRPGDELGIYEVDATSVRTSTIGR